MAVRDIQRASGLRRFHECGCHRASSILRCVAAAVMVASMVVAVPTTAVAQGDGFSDVTEGVHTPAIDALAEKGVFEGTLCGEDMFCPTEPIKRSEMAVWLIRALEDDQLPAAGSTRFADVDADVWWAPYVERLAELEITVGCGQEPLSYCPDTSVSRGQMATFLVRAFDLEAAGPAGFVDTEGSTHEANIDALAAAGITVGCTRDPLQFCTGDPVRRSQMATFLARALGLVETPSTSAQQPEEEPEEEETGPAVVADPATVLTPGTYDFTIEGTGFDPSLTMYVLECTIPGDPLSHDTPADELDAAMAQVDRSDCDLSTAQPVSLDSSGSFSVERSATVGANFMWVAADAAETQTAGAPVLIVGSSAVSEATAPPDTYTAVASGAGHHCALRTDGILDCEGMYFDHETGQVVEDVEIPEGTFSSIAAGWTHACGLRTDGTADCWGANTHGQARPPRARIRFSAIDAGHLHSCAVGVNGWVTCWGANTFGQSESPARRGFVAIDAGIWHTCGVLSDGSISCWGDNAYGQVDAPTRGSFSHVAAGAAHSCGLGTDGTISCWGTSNIGIYVEQTVAPEGTFTAISGGAWHTCGIRTDGTIVCWGYRQDVEDATARTSVPDGTYTAVSAGWSDTCAINNRGEVVCFQ